MRVRKEEVDQCAFCGADGVLTRDHIPPKGIFAKPRPDNLITVQACTKCHSQQTSRDDEYFRNALIVREELSQHPEVLKVQPTVMRSLSSPHKAGMLAEFLKNIRLIERVTPGGIFIRKQLALQTDMVRIRRVVQRILTGLFYHHKKHRLPVGYDALVFNDESLQNWRANQLAVWQKKVIKPLLAQNAITIGNGVFSYSFGFDTSDPDTTYWILVFYERAGFLGLTVPSEQNI
jgi:hypothetical protein